MSVGFEKLPFNGGSLVQIANVVNLLVDGKSNNFGSFTLTASATSTAVSDLRAGSNSIILFTPMTANAATAVATTYISARAKQSFTITHANNGETDRTFTYIVIA